MAGMGEPVYPIGVVSRLLGVHPRMLRIYEKEGLVKPARIGGKRYYRESDLQKLRCIRLLLEEGVNIAGIKRLLSVAPCWRVIGCPDKKRLSCAYFREHGRWRMRIAFATEAPGGLEAEIAYHFRRAPFFTFVDLDEDGEILSVEVLENPALNVHRPFVVPSFIKQQGADVIVAGGMGERAKLFFEQEGIETVTGAQGRVVDVLSAILKGERFGDNLCDKEEGHEGMCHGHGGGA